MPRDELGPSKLPHRAAALPPGRLLQPGRTSRACTVRRRSGPWRHGRPDQREADAVSHGHPERRRYTIGPLEFAPEDLCVSVAGKRVWLSRRELEVLEVLAQSAGHPVARDEVHRRVWGGRVAGFKDRSVEVYMRGLRVKLAAAEPDWDHIHTHHNIGYRLDPATRGRSRHGAVITVHQHVSMGRP